MSSNTQSDEEKVDVAAAEQAAEESPRQIHGFSWFLVVCSIMSSMFIYALDGTITADLVPAISNEFGSVELLPWLSVGFMAGAAVALLPVGKLYSKYDGKWVYIISVIIFLAASAVCGAAPNMNAMIVGRVLLGVSGSGVYCGILFLMSVFAAPHERPVYISAVGAVWGLGTCLGPLVGGGFERVNWRWGFYINLIVGGVFMPVYLFMIPSYDPLKGKTIKFRQRGKDFDLIGTILFTGFVMCLVLAINFGGVLYAWNSGSTIALLVVGVVLFIAFGVQQGLSWFTSPTERLFPVHLLRIKEANLLFSLCICTNVAFFVPVYYIPIYFQFTRGDGALDAAVRLLPLIIVSSFAMILNGLFMVRFGYYFPWYIFGLSLALAGTTLLYMIGVDTPTAKIYGYEVLIGMGIGSCNQIGYAAIHYFIPAEDGNFAVPFMMIAQYSGITLGLSVCGALFINKALEALRELLPGYTESQLNDITSGTSGHALQDIPEELQRRAIEILVEALRSALIPTFVFAALGLILACFLSKKKIFQKGTKAVVHAG